MTPPEKNVWARRVQMHRALLKIAQFTYAKYLVVINACLFMHEDKYS